MHIPNSTNVCTYSCYVCDEPLFAVQESNTEAKLSDISAALSVSLQQDCSCSLSVQQSLFSCLGTEDSQTVVFLARLSYTALPGVDLPSLLTTWVGSTPPITVASTQLQVDTTCPVVIDSLEPDGCAPSPSTTPSGSADTTAYLILCILIALFVVSISTHALTLVLLLVICRRLRKLDR